MSFDRIAFFYDGLAWLVFGNWLQRAQLTHLHQLAARADAQPPIVLLLGGGTGWLLKPLLALLPNSRVVYLEASAQMLARSSERMARQGLAGTVEFRLGDETNLYPGEQFDMIFTPFVLDLFTNQALENQLIPRLQAALKPDGLWFVTDFVHTTVWWQRALLWLMIAFFRATAGIGIGQLADWQQCLAEAGLMRIKEQRHVGGMVSAEVWRG
ncbi:class I SAM-dependent methyltransferase [Spirosoma montaniterrae]|uniref:Methyltransferase type 12 n=1 Tax=Spirosoma montaniterrae TaxID=1178516 RepID=A0A1P9WUP6_9BACT|nr:class I SAM-dependent methyltransferase [Spirosoma montaniterrae]AQG79107.1 methyltransferase type 12 [Spirosoma montaniterrae]